VQKAESPSLSNEFFITEFYVRVPGTQVRTKLNHVFLTDRIVLRSSSNINLPVD
jgi:hypothetical protein